MRLYFATDIHGSEKCWRKFLAAGKHYGADAIVMGGDICGKFIVPIVTDSRGGGTATFLGVKRRAKNPEQLAILKRQIADTGAIGAELDPEQIAELESDQTGVEKLFLDLAMQRLHDWIAMAEQQLRGQGIRCIVNGGNDDPFAIDEVIRQSDVVELGEGRVIEFDDSVEMISLGWSNMTPWHCPRDTSEQDLADRIAEQCIRLEDPATAIFNFHIPPFDSGLDIAPRLREDFSVELDGLGTPIMTPVGSTAVRDAIVEYQPLLGLHGHIHESAGVKQIGRTVIVNPGSEYGEGILHGAIIDIDTSRGAAAATLVTG
jgi:Icc-related predicted phosphoesterase